MPIYEISNSGLNIYDVMKNYTYKFLNKSNETRISVMVYTMASSYIDGKPTLLNITPQPIESITVDIILYKCFTFFSHLQDEWRLSSIEFDTITINIENDHTTLIDTAHPLPFIMHSPNEMPTLKAGKYKVIESNGFYVIQYSQYHIKKLGYGYDTNCRDYGPDMIRPDCIESCHQKHHDLLCNESGQVQSSR